MLALNSAASLARRGARALSTAALPSTPPISLFGISGRYASAMYTAAAKKGELLAVEADLQQLEAAMAASPSVATFLKDPSQGRNAKASSVIEILTAAKACQTSKNSLATVAEGGRMGDVSKIIDDYMSLMTAAKGDVTATVTSAHPLTDEETKAIRAKLTEFLGPGQKQVTMKTRVNKGLINGYTVDLGDKFIDYSTATQLKKLASLLNVA